MHFCKVTSLSCVMFVKRR